MTTDRELLEKAAKAAGIVIMPCTCGSEKWPFKHDEVRTGKRGHWNPLVDDGDALRLAVKLRISMIHEQEYVGGPVVETLEALSPPESGTGNRTVSTECLNELGSDEYAATRRAIVRAAAAIGEQMP